MLPKTFNIILTIIKKNLSTNLIIDQYSMEDASLNNDRLKDTPFYISDIQEWVLDIVMKESINISKSEVDSENVIETNDPKLGKFISEAYSKLLKLHRLLLISSSKRKEKAMSMFNKCILKFFNSERCLYLKDLFVLYSDISHFIKKHDDFEYIEQLGTIREEVFYKILKQSTVLDIDLDLSNLMLKARIKQKEFDFEELLVSFVSVQTQKFFKIQFFEKLFESFASLVIKPKKINEKDKSTLKELAQYLIDISYEIDSKLINNLEKISSIYKVLDSSLQTTIDLYESDEFNLSKSELRGIIRNIFEDSALRENFIEQLM